MRNHFFLFSIALVFLLTGCQAAPPAKSATVLPTQTADPLPTPTPTLSPSPSASPTPTGTPQPTEVPLPDSFYIDHIYGHRQYFSIGCETSAAVDWANFFGTFIYESDFQFAMPLSDNPDKGFVGDVSDPWGMVPPYSYGVHADPIAATLREFGVPAQSAHAFTLEQLKAELASGEPVIAWVIGNVVGGVPAEYTDSAGDTTIVAAYEHVIIVTGYAETSLRYLNNGHFYDIPTDVFLNSWGVLGNQVVYHADHPPLP